MRVHSEASLAARAEKYARIKDPTLKEHWVYYAYDEQGRTLYVGCSRNLKQRAYSHRHSSAWVPLAVSFKAIGPFNYRTARRVERMAQVAANPLYGMTPLNQLDAVMKGHATRRAGIARRNAVA